MVGSPMLACHLSIGSWLATMVERVPWRSSVISSRSLRSCSWVVPVHTPVHASWLNQIEVYFSIIQRKVLTPNDFTSLAEVEDRLLRFQSHYEQIATPCRWPSSRQDLAVRLEKIQAKEWILAKAA